MKQYLRQSAILVISIFLLASAGCGKKSVRSEFSHRIIGKWNWVESVGGIGGWRLTPDSEGYTKKHVFLPDFTFLGYRNDTLTVAAKYTIREKVVWGKDTAEVLQIEGQMEQVIGFRGNDTLELVDHAYDGFNHLFVRVRGD
jgi:hypothetical protein